MLLVTKYGNSGSTSYRNVESANVEADRMIAIVDENNKFERIQMDMLDTVSVIADGKEVVIYAGGCRDGEELTTSDDLRLLALVMENNEHVMGADAGHFAESLRIAGDYLGVAKHEEAPAPECWSFPNDDGTVTVVHRNGREEVLKVNDQPEGKRNVTAYDQKVDGSLAITPAVSGDDEVYFSIGDQLEIDMELACELSVLYDILRQDADEKPRVKAKRVFAACDRAESVIKLIRNRW